MKRRWIGLGIAIILLLGLLMGRLLLAEEIGARLNGVRDPGPYRIPPAAAALHRRLFIADLHADPLLWERDLGQRGSWGQVDLPRLIEGNVALQVFGLVTQVPRGLNFRSNPSDSDILPALTAAQGWPPATWTSPLARALHQAGRLDRLVQQAPERLMWLRSAGDVETLLARRRAGEPVIGAMLALEGAHALENGLADLDKLHATGLRMLGLTHFFDNAYAGSAHGERKHGLTAAGIELIARAERLGIWIDLAHASPRAFAETLQRATRPVVVSHTGVAGTCPGPRNLTDAQLRAVAANGGLVAIALFEGAVCGKSLAATARAMRYTADLIGVAHVALGSDFDGAITTPVDASGLGLLVAEMQSAGFSAAEIGDILGGNWLRLLQNQWAR